MHATLPITVFLFQTYKHGGSCERAALRLPAGLNFWPSTLSITRRCWPPQIQSISPCPVSCSRFNLAVLEIKLAVNPDYHRYTLPQEQHFQQHLPGQEGLPIYRDQPYSSKVDKVEKQKDRVDIVVIIGLRNAWDLCRWSALAQPGQAAVQSARWKMLCPLNLLGRFQLSVIFSKKFSMSIIFSQMLSFPFAKIDSIFSFFFFSFNLVFPIE